MATRLLLPRAQRVLLDGRPASGAKLYTYVTGTSTPKATYSDAALTVPNANPVVADASGVFSDIFPEGGSYRLRLEDADGNLLFTADDVDGAASTGGGGTTSSPLRNRILNGAMQVSQQNGASNVDTTTGDQYALDQWFASLSTTPGGTLRLARSAAITPGGSPNRLLATAQVADSALAAGDRYAISQRIEGVRIADMRFGTASARQLLLRFGVRASVAGIYGVALRNSARNRSYVATFTVAAGEINTDLLREITIPGDTAGTWLVDTGIGIEVTWTLGAGTTFQGALGWQTGDFLTTPSQTNLMATGAATFELFDVGLYVDAAAVGTFPAYEIADFADELAACQRYWVETGRSVTVQGFNSASAWSQRVPLNFPVQMRVAPTAAITGTSSNTNVASAVIDNIGVSGFTFSITSAATGGFFITYNNVTFTARL